MSTKEYFLGIDAGIGSVGWAVTDMNYNLIRMSGKDMWGVREFDEAEKSDGRRKNRTNRRRKQREQVRNGLLRSYFADEINKVDPEFFVRLDNSKYYLEDKDIDTINVLFDDENYQDHDYFEEFPTVFHLRKELIENPEPHDVRKVYLAISNMFKHRGHFLTGGLTEDGKEESAEELYEVFRKRLLEYTGLVIPEGLGSKVASIIGDSTLIKTKKKSKMREVLEIGAKEKEKDTLTTLLSGAVTDADKLFPDLVLDEKTKIEFSSATYNDKIDDVYEIIGDEYAQVIAAAKNLYDKAKIDALLGKDNIYISVAKVRLYEKHKKDLRRLKNLYKKYHLTEKKNNADPGVYEPSVYDEMFRLPIAGTYSAYVKSTISAACKKADESICEGNQQRRGMRKTREDKNDVKDIEKRIKKDFSNLIIKKEGEKKEEISDPELARILTEIELGTFLPKQRTSENGILPNYIHAIELKKILKNAEGYLPFLREKDETGLSISEKILALFSFRIPYYVGPTTENSALNGGNGWVVRKEGQKDGHILPWNMEEKIDIDKTEEKFIKNLIRNCTYISGEKVMPKHSIEYEAFSVLNQINNIRILGEKIPLDVKQELFRELFMKKEKVTYKQIVKYLLDAGYVDSESNISGVDVEFSESFSSYIKMEKILGEEMKNDSGKRTAEKILEAGTIFRQSKERFRHALDKMVSNGQITEEQKIAVIKRGFKFKEWGRFSKKFLEMEGFDVKTGKPISLIRAMWEYNMNLMELINDPGFGFKEQLENQQKQFGFDINTMKFEDLDSFYFSNTVKRSIWQAVLVVREVMSIMKCPPKKLFIEVTRSEEQIKTRKESRVKQLEKLYDNLIGSGRKKESSLSGETQAWVDKNMGRIKELQEELKTISKNDDGKLKSDRWYLYYMQMGRDIYTGKPINPEDVTNENLYDKDHIIPKSFKRDDSIINNRVLTSKPINHDKGDEYPIRREIRNNPEIRALWDILHAKKFMSDEKYNRLTRSRELSEEDIAGYISSMLVDTSQATTGMARIFKQIFPEEDHVDVIFSKAIHVADFRKKFKIPKCRLLNEFHHAQDAYLNIVVGNIYDVKFSKSPANYIKEQRKKKPENTGRPYHYGYNAEKMFEYDISRNGVTAWKADETINVVKKMLSRNTPMTSNMCMEGHGELFDVNIVSAKNARKTKKGGYLPVKSSDSKIQDTKKYGGFNGIVAAYFFLVEHEKKGKRIRTIETVPLYLKAEIEGREDGLRKYCEDALGLIKPDIRLSKIRPQSLIKIDGYYAYMTGKSANYILVRNATNLCLRSELSNFIKLLEKMKGSLSSQKDEKKEWYFKDTKEKENAIENASRLFQELKEKHCEGIFSRRMNPVGKIIEKGEDYFYKLSFEDQCEALIHMLELTRIGGSSADLTKINGKSNSGKLYFNSDITEHNISEITLINQSVTGFYEKKVDLKTV